MRLQTVILKPVAYIVKQVTTGIFITSYKPTGCKFPQCLTSPELDLGVVLFPDPKQKPLSMRTKLRLKLLKDCTPLLFNSLFHFITEGSFGQLWFLMCPKMTAVS